MIRNGNPRPKITLDPESRGHASGHRNCYKRMEWLFRAPHPVCCLCHTGIPPYGPGTVQYKMEDGTEITICYSHLLGLSRDTNGCALNLPIEKPRFFELDEWLLEIKKIVEEEIANGSLTRAQNTLRIISKFLKKSGLEPDFKEDFFFLAQQVILPTKIYKFLRSHPNS